MTRKAVPEPIILFFQKVGHLLFFVVLKIFVRLEIVGKEKIKNIEGPIILAPNHTSEMDVLALPSVLPFWFKRNPIYFVVNPDHKFKGGFGWRSYLYGEKFFSILGGYAFNPGFKDYSKALSFHRKLLEKQKTLVIFPEGKRTRNGVINPARGGLGFLIWKTNATVVPVAIDTFFNISFWEFIFAKRKVKITVCDPIKYSDFNFGDMPGAEEFRGVGELVLQKIKEKIHS